MGDVRRNCWTCAYNRPLAGRYTCDSDHEDVWLWQDDTRFDRVLMPAKDADGCPGWKPKPKPENTDRAQVAAYGSIPIVVDPTLPEGTAFVVKRAEWDALIARIDELERLGLKTARDVVRLRRKG